LHISGISSWICLAVSPLGLALSISLILGVCGFFTLFPEEPFDGMNADSKPGGYLFAAQPFFFELDGPFVVKVSGFTP
jgi:hypothetical protein